MQRKLICVLAACALCSGPSIVKSAEEPAPLSKEQITETVNLLSDCSGYWEFGAEIQDQSQKSTVESVRAVSRGAEMAASYLLALEAASNGKKRRPLADFSEYVQSRKSITLQRMRAFFEQKNEESLRIQKEKCVAIAEVQEALIQQVRDGAIDR